MTQPIKTVDVDLLVYSGMVSMTGYQKVCEALVGKGADRAMVALATPGGDAHAGFRIARALQHTYEKFDALVPRYCKSAGTLILIGASTLYLDDMSELGPLDVQVKKGDELIGRNSGLDIFQAVNYLQNQTLAAFSTYLVELTQGAGLSTRVASDIACRLTTAVFEPIAAQIDPIKLAEMQRATEIAFEYGNRLNEKSQNLQTGGIAKLVTGYPSHGFVIDRREARNIFLRVERPLDLLAKCSATLRTNTDGAAIDSEVPDVQLLKIQLPEEAISHAHPSDAKGRTGGIAPGESAVSGDLAGSESQPRERDTSAASADAGAARPAPPA